LVEKEIKFSVHGALEDVPIVDPPKRVSGYFKLDRTKDAHMFYFFYESRNKGSDDPVVLWMTGACAGFSPLQPPVSALPTSWPVLNGHTMLSAGGPGCSSEIAIFYGTWVGWNELAYLWPVQV
jgi:vitellogenic carboxypeptidase-like protein/serine carboxypeptidase-like clade 4